MKQILITVLTFAISMGTMAGTKKGPTMGWSSWNTFSVNISEDIIKGQANAMVNQGLKDVGYEYINIDDGFQYGRTAEGLVRIHPVRFPNGLKVVSDYIHSKGLKAGIYSDAGDCTCGSISNGDVLNTNVGMYGYEQVDANYYFKDLEFDFIKIDYCGGRNLSLNEQEQYTRIRDAIVNTGRDVRYNICRWDYPGTWCNGVATSWRTTPDIYDGWESVKGILRDNLYLSAYCYDGGFNDMDMLEVGRSMTAEEDKTHFGMWCIMASPLLIGCNMATINERALALLKNTELIALNQDPLLLQAYVVQHIGDTYVLVKDIQNLHSTTRAVALYNPSDKPVQMCVSFGELELGGKVTIRDLFEHEDLGQMEHALSVLVPAHGTRIYSLNAEQRLTRYLYEAETAFLHDYQEVANNEALGTAIYQSSDAASGREFAGWLGNRRSNYLEWRDVYVPEAGQYVLRFNAGSQAARSFTVEVNGEQAGTVDVKTPDWNDFQEFELAVNLKAGTNNIQLYNENDWMPNLDYMTVEKQGETMILNRQLNETTARMVSLANSNILPTAFIQKVNQLAIQASDTNLTTEDKKNALNEVESSLTAIDTMIPLCKEFSLWKSNVEKNINASLESTALTALRHAMETADGALSQATTTTKVNSILSTLKTAVGNYFRAEEAQPHEGEELDMTLLLTNYDFSKNTGWRGNPTYRSGCGEEFNKDFDMYQQLGSMKPGIYTVKCNALIRVGKNDGGEAYRAGTENNETYFYVNSETQKVKSLFSEEWPEASKYGWVDNQNGYPHSMHAAETRFSEGAYENVITYKLEKKGTLTIGIELSNHQEESWCCFDNFSITYNPLTNTGIKGTKKEPRSSKTYNLLGHRVKENQTGLVIKNRRKVLQ
ncbi:carbohydrate-binding protein [Prevotella sp. P6B4]|uniref:alpha-galactosidase D n=1 Tax=Prevotella sp. P6B4 TaxID=1410614 RepID=UPI0009DD6D63|nr:carbohydrate-binding protein [Prevotella sp. P6B4]